MNPDELRAMKDELHTLSVNVSEKLSRLADRLIAGNENGAAGHLLVFERYARQSFGNVLRWFVERAAVDPEPAPAKRGGGRRAPKGQGSHRHKFNEAGVCACGAKRQRAPKGSGSAQAVPEPLSAEARTGNIPGTGGVDVRDNGDWR